MSLFGNKQSGEAGSGARGKGGNSGYGIAETTLLMRSLPVDQNVELVVRVVRSTLESMNVQLPEIIEDAAAKEKELQARMATLNGEIAEFSKQIEGRRQEIARLEEELTETTTVKERLLLAQKLAGKPVTIPGKASNPSTAVTPPPLPLRIPAKSAVG
jgi:DNA repair exonuclease SbcCD ATPase subunit